MSGAAWGMGLGGTGWISDEAAMEETVLALRDARRRVADLVGDAHRLAAIVRWRSPAALAWQEAVALVVLRVQGAESIIERALSDAERGLDDAQRAAASAAATPGAAP